MDNYLRELLENPESPSDTVLATQIQMQLVMEQVNQSNWQTSAPVSTQYAGVLRAKLRKIQASVPLEHKNKGA